MGACLWAFTDSAQFGWQRPVGAIQRRVRERRQPSPRPRSQSGTEKAGHTPPWVVTSRVKAAQSASAVLAVIQAEQDNPDLNLISISAAWSALVRQQRSITANVINSPSLTLFINLTKSLLGRPSGNSRAVTGLFWAAAKLCVVMCSQMKALWPSLALAVKSIVRETDAQGISNVVYAIEALSTDAEASESVVSLLPLLAGRIPTVVFEMTAQAVANVIWVTGQVVADPGRASVSEDLRRVLPHLVARFNVLLPSATPQALANTCWGLALSGYDDPGLLKCVGNKVATEAAGWRTSGAEKDLPEVLCAFARLKARGHDDMLDAAARKLTPMLSNINDWHLCVLNWSYKELDTDDFFLAFRQDLGAEVTCRGFSDHDVEGSCLGPETWKKEHGRLRRT